MAVGAAVQVGGQRQAPDVFAQRVFLGHADGAVQLDGLAPGEARHLGNPRAERGDTLGRAVLGGSQAQRARFLLLDDEVGLESRPSASQMGRTWRPGYERGDPSLTVDG